MTRHRPWLQELGMIYLGDGVVGGCLAAHEVVVGINPIVAFENSYRMWRTGTKWF